MKTERPIMYNHFDHPPKPEIGGGLSKTKQSELDACDVNKIVARYDRTGYLPEDGREALYLDVTNMPDYRSALDQVNLANEFFTHLPAQVRARFDNDPALFLDFCADPGNRPELITLGLLPAPEEPPAPPAPPTPPPPPAA